MKISGIKTRISRAIIPSLLTCILALGAAGCSDSEFDRLSRDNHNPTGEAVNARLQLTDAVVATAYSTLGGAYAWYAASYTEQMFGCGNNLLMQAELRDPLATAASTTFNNEWNGTYANLQNIRQIIDKCAPGGLNAGQSDILGMAETLWVINFSTLTLLHGDIPYSEALDEKNRAPHLDCQTDIYADLLRIADSALRHLEEAVEGGMDNAGSHDPLYGGNAASWLALAHAVKAQLLLTGSALYPDNLAEAATEAETALKSGFTGAWLELGATSSDPSWYAFNKSRHYLGANATCASLMEKREDPRLPLYASDIYSTGVTLAPAGNEALAVTTEQVGAPMWLLSREFPQPILSGSQVWFILAETRARAGLDFTTALRAGVEASMMEWSRACGTGLGESATYTALLPVTLREVMVQKYMACSLGETIATYNDLRRLRALGETVVELHNPENMQKGANRWPLRMPYGDSDVVSNPNVTAAFGTGNSAGVYIFTDPVELYAPVK